MSQLSLNQLSTIKLIERYFQKLLKEQVRIYNATYALWFSLASIKNVQIGP